MWSITDYSQPNQLSDLITTLYKDNQILNLWIWNLTQLYFQGVVVVRTVMPNQSVRRKTSSSYHYSGGGGPYQN